jgi:quercetin dioxygenase-like cupin family protein
VPEFLDVNGLYEDRDRLAEGEVVVIPLAELEDLRVRLLVTRRGEWPSHRDEGEERYIILRGAVEYTTEHTFTVREGQMITFQPGEEHAARIQEGAVSIHIDRHRGVSPR